MRCINWFKSDNYVYWQGE